MAGLWRVVYIVAVAIYCGTPSQAWFMSLTRTRSSHGGCYRSPNLGCFPITYPHNNTDGMEPQPPGDIDVEFSMKRRGLTRRAFNVATTRQALRGYYQPTQKTVVLIHGYMESCHAPWMTSMANELLRKEPMNVICVNWSLGAGNIIYAQSAANTRIVGALMALVLQDLVRLGGDMANFHLIGYSLGAHVSGHAGKRLEGLGRITGLDPAGPFFDGVHPDARLSSDDALLVDVVHTDANPPIGLGAVQPMGDLDFYVNGGSHQPGCYSYTSFLDRISFSSRQSFMHSLTNTMVCNHHRAVQLFKSTVRSTCTFSTYRCDRVTHLSRHDCRGCGTNTPCPNMGYDLDQDGTVLARRGIYRPETSGSHPFC